MKNNEKISNVFELVNVKRNKKPMVASKFVILQIFEDSRAAAKAGNSQRPDK